MRTKMALTPTFYGAGVMSEYAAGKFGSIEQTAFLPVTIEQSEEESLKDTAPEPTGYLELQIGAARLIIHGSPDRMVLKSVIEELR